MPAVMRNVDARAVRGLDDRLALLEGNLSTINLERRHLDVSWEPVGWGARGSKESSPSAVALPTDHVEGAEARHHVRHHRTRDDPLEPAGDEKTRRTDAHAIRRAAAVADQVEAELAIAAFAVGIDFTGRNFEAFHDDLEVPDRAFDGRVDFALGRQHHARIVHVDGAGVGQLAESLFDDARALLHLLEAHHEAIVTVAL